MCQGFSPEQAVNLTKEDDPSWFVSQLETKSAHHSMQHLAKVMTRLVSTYKISPSDIYVVPVLNWTSPSMIASENQRIQASVLGGLLNGEREGNALGIYFSPAHCYTRGGLYKQEKTSMDLLAKPSATWILRSLCLSRAKPMIQPP